MDGRSLFGASALLFFTVGLPGCGAGTTKGAENTGGDVGVRWVGRVDVTDSSAPRFAWSGTGFLANVSGTSVGVTLRSDSSADPVFFQPLIDGVPGARFSVAQSEGEKTVTLGSNLPDGEHAVELYRETEGKPGFAVSTFLGFREGTLGKAPPRSERFIEIIGDSISAGYGNLGSEEHPNYGPDPNGGCRFSTETESAYATYGMIAGRAVGAEVSIVAASGWGIYSDNSGNRQNVLPSIYANTVGGQATPSWDFAREPQAIVINLGTNDFSANMELSGDAFTPPFRAFVATIREKYPNAMIYCAIGPLLYGTGLANARTYLNDMVASANAEGDAKVKLLDFGQQNGSLGTGCDWHPNVTEHQRMADVLVTTLRADLAW